MKNETKALFFFSSIVFAFLSPSLAKKKEKTANAMEDFTYHVYNDAEATNIQQLKDEKRLREGHSVRVDLPEIDFDPKTEKHTKKIFKIVTFEFAKSSEEGNDMPELGLSAFQITNQIKRHSNPTCNKTLKGDPKKCRPVVRTSFMEFFSVPFDTDKKFHRTYGQFNAGFRGSKEMEKYLIFHKDESVTAAFDYPDTQYPKLGVSGDAHVDLYEPGSHVWVPRCKEHPKKCMRAATCGVKVKGKDDVEKAAHFCCLCVPGVISNAFPTPCGINVTKRYESFKMGEEGCDPQEESCPYNPNPMVDTKCAKTFGSCPMTCKCGTPKDMHPCMHPFTKRPRFPLFPELQKQPTRRRDGPVGAAKDPNGASILSPIDVVVFVVAIFVTGSNVYGS